MGEYSAEHRQRIIEHVLSELAGGRFVSRTLREDREDHNLCDHATFWRWVNADQDLRDKLGRAREDGIEAILDEIPDIADDGTNDWITKERDDGSTYETLNGEHVQRSKLRIETRFKMAQMMKPKTYGPKLDLTSGGEKLGLAEAIEAGRKRVEQGMDDGGE